MARALWLIVALRCLADCATVYDVSVFEQQTLPKWVAQFELPGVGNFSFQPHSTVPHPYAASDVLHTLCFTGQLKLTSSEKLAYAAAINSFQTADGFYEVGVPPGGTSWHAVGYITAGLSLIESSPARPNLLLDHIASTPSLWEPTVAALLNVDAHPSLPQNISGGCANGYQCAQNIASLLSWYIQTNSSATHGGGISRYSDFVRWYLDYLSAQADPHTGLWCSKAQRLIWGEINCIGGSFHIDFIYQFLSLHPEYAPRGARTWQFPYPEQQLNASLGLQQASGGWTQDGMAYLNVDGIYQATRTSLQAGKLRWQEVEQACEKLMGLVVPALNDEARVLGELSETSHKMPALVAAVAECQKQFPEMINSTRPWNMCLDQVPYI